MLSQWSEKRSTASVYSLWWSTIRVRVRLEHLSARALPRLWHRRHFRITALCTLWGKKLKKLFPHLRSKMYPIYAQPGGSAAPSQISVFTSNTGALQTEMGSRSLDIPHSDQPNVVPKHSKSVDRCVRGRRLCSTPTTHVGRWCANSRPTSSHKHTSFRVRRLLPFSPGTEEALRYPWGPTNFIQGATGTEPDNG